VRLRVVALALAALTLALSASAPAASSRPRLGVFGPIDRFHGLTGQRSQVGHVIFGWGQATFAQLIPQLGEMPMIGFDTGNDAITPLAIARGRGDTYLFELNQAAAAFGRPIYIRPMGEMNGHWNAYCAYNRNGTPRDAAHSTLAFRQAFARIYLIVHGGPATRINAALRKLGLPPIGHNLPETRAVVVWNPQGYGSPDVPGNRAAAYYPGDRFVDMVGNDLYDIGGKAEWAAAEALYKAHPTKPYAFPEWGLWGIDDPKFVERMAQFVETHTRTKLIAYFNAKPGSIFDLASKPRSLAAYKRLIVPLGR
jgi:hypothetical protein